MHGMPNAAKIGHVVYLLCSAHSKNLRNPSIAQRNIRILSLLRNPRIVQLNEQNWNRRSREGEDLLSREQTIYSS